MKIQTASKAKLLITIFLGMSFRNLVLSGVIDALAEQFDVTCLVLENDRALAKALQNRGIKLLIECPGILNRFWMRVFRSLETVQYYSFYIKHRPKTAEKYIERDRKQKRFFKAYYFAAQVLGSLLPKYRFLQFQYRYYLSLQTRKALSGFDKIFMLSTDVLYDKAVLQNANALGIESSVLVHSWDNLPGRGYIAGRPDRLLVWNKPMVEQAQVLHNIPRSKCAVVGVPQFDLYNKVSDEMNDKDVVNESGIALGKKVILYTCSAARIFPDEDRFIHLLAKIAERRDALLLVRLHPTERQAEYRELFGSDPRIILDTPSGEFAAAAVNNLDAGLKGVRRFVAVIRRADVVINLASTISLDAILFDRPVICPAFNLDPGLQGQWNDAQRWYESSHFEAIARSKAVKVVYNQDELQLAVDECLEEPFADHAKREQILREFTGDGSHSTREILATLSERAPTSHN